MARKSVAVKLSDSEIAKIFDEELEDFRDCSGKYLATKVEERILNVAGLNPKWTKVWRKVGDALDQKSKNSKIDVLAMEVFVDFILRVDDVGSNGRWRPGTYERLGGGAYARVVVTDKGNANRVR
jgi:hypothetical protein